MNHRLYHSASATTQIQLCRSKYPIAEKYFDARSRVVADGHRARQNRRAAFVVVAAYWRMARVTPAGESTLLMRTTMGTALPMGAVLGTRALIWMRPWMRPGAAPE